MITSAFYVPAVELYVSKHHRSASPLLGVALLPLLCQELVHSTSCDKKTYLSALELSSFEPSQVNFSAVTEAE